WCGPLRLHSRGAGKVLHGAAHPSFSTGSVNRGADRPGPGTIQFICQGCNAGTARSEAWSPARSSDKTALSREQCSTATGYRTRPAVDRSADPLFAAAADAHPTAAAQVTAWLADTHFQPAQMAFAPHGHGSPGTFRAMAFTGIGSI